MTLLICPKMADVWFFGCLLEGEVVATLLYWMSRLYKVWIDIFCCHLKTSHLFAFCFENIFTFIAHKKRIFLLHNSQKCSTFALDLRQRHYSAIFAIKPLNKFLTMMNWITLKQQTQDFVLRLFVESSGDHSTPSTSYYTNAHCGTFSRMRQWSCSYTLCI